MPILMGTFEFDAEHTFVNLGMEEIGALHCTLVAFDLLPTSKSDL
jgi:hypothetical protein